MRPQPTSVPSVQIGDPFMGKKLIECTLELLDRGLLASLQDLGAAGLASSTSEMAAGGGVGLDVDLSRVPLREEDMEPFEIMISESQERMCAIVEPSRLDAVIEACARWDIDATVIGEVTEDGASCVRSTTARWWARSPSRRWSTARPATRSERTRPARLADRPLDVRAGDRHRGRAADAARLAESAPAAAGSTSSTTSWSARAPWCGPAAMPAWCG